MSNYTHLAKPIAESFQRLSVIFSNIDAPSPWDTEVQRFTSWGYAVGLGQGGVMNAYFSGDEWREYALLHINKLGADFADEQTMTNICGLTKKKTSSLKKGLRKLTGKSTAPEGGPSDMLTQKWSVKIPSLWNVQLQKAKGEIHLLLTTFPVPTASDSGGLSSVIQSMGGMNITDSNQPVPVPPPAPATKSVEEQEAERMYSELNKLEDFVKDIDKGSLNVILSPATNYSARVTVKVYFDDDYDETRQNPWKDQLMGYTKMGHGSFEPYHRGRYIKERNSKYSTDTDEDYVILSVEAHPKYENINPGTVTLEGFGMEAWDYEQTNGRQRENSVFVSYASMPEVSAKKLIRRIDEFQTGKVSKLGWNPKKEAHDLQEFFGNMGTTYIASISQNDPMRIIDFYQQLNRRDIYADFTSISSVSTQWAQPKGEGVIGIWNFLYQVILAKELSMRLLTIADGSYSGFTARVLASLILSDLWLRNVRISLEKPKIPEGHIHKATTPEDANKATDHMNTGHEAAKIGDWEKAVDEYSEAIKIDNSISAYFVFRALAYVVLNKAAHATDDANEAISLDSKNTLAWSALGDASVGMDRLRKAKEAYTTAISLASSPDPKLNLKLEDVNAKISAKVAAISNETNIDRALTLEKEYNDEDYEIAGKTLEFSSRVHERQVEGLIIFAEKMKWPWLHELREGAENVYGQIRNGQVTPFHVVDWIYGTTLPGEWMALKIMSAMMLLTESVKGLGIAPYYGCGFATKDKSYHRLRNVLGRVLGAMPGVISLCGWIGPCMPVTFDPPLAEPLGDTKKGKHIRVKARNVGLIDPPDPNDNVIRLGGGESHLGIRPKPGENFENYLAEIKDMSNWQAPKPPQRIKSTTTVKRIILKELPLESSIDPTDAVAVEEGREYRASIDFDVDGTLATYTLFTNPVFATPPACSGGPRGQHEVHKRELEYFGKIVPAESLKDYTLGDDEIVVINASGVGAEVLARAWCAERGKAAIIRRIGGPCYACTMKTVRELKQKVIIWVDGVEEEYHGYT